MATEEAAAAASVVVAKTTVVVVESTTTTSVMEPEAPAMAPGEDTDMAEAPQQEEEVKIEPKSVNKGRRNNTSKVFKKRVAKKEPEPEPSAEDKEQPKKDEDKAMEVSEGAKANEEAVTRFSEEKRPVKRARSKISDEKKQPKGAEAAHNGSKKPLVHAKPLAAHPPYLQMIMEAISSLKDRTGSSLYAIAKYIDEKYHSGLPDNFRKTLSVQLRNLANNGKLIRVKNSFKLAEELKKAAASAAKVNSSKPNSTKTISEVYQTDSVEKSKKSAPKKATPAAKRARRAVK